ncbi:hypothetical protein M2277_004987 [Paenibacillus sp. LBL]|uniref:hypothetical protein n=1 Tax=Paenibacillus sp. LBL TaxID=2940563 RepID=UPI0024757BB2|nr:hypothetical protein [Paenibacillus sp. LBL]MDH6674295.1 hypothetical protein [Paenibacillus sp. LBL]
MGELKRKFKVGDIVKVQGYRDEFEIVGYMHQSIYVMGTLDEEILYTVKEKASGCVLEKSEDKLSYAVSHEKMRELAESIERQLTNDALDMYNDLMALHLMFGDKQYKQQANKIVKELKRYYNNKDNY